MVIFALVWALTLGRHHLWILPNLTEDVSFVESFWPLYKHEYKGEGSGGGGGDAVAAEKDKSKKKSSKQDKNSEQEKQQTENENTEPEKDSEAESVSTNEIKHANDFEILDSNECSED